MSASPPPGPDLRSLNASFRRSLRARNKSDRTVEAYTDAVRFFADFLEATNYPLTLRGLKREHVESFIADQLGRWKPSRRRTTVIAASKPSSSGP
jgi:Phage integrase, N-terminal SAM-like domain